VPAGAKKFDVTAGAGALTVAADSAELLSAPLK
jgi:hypothetical protein